jgi:hypothetical protein
MPGVLTPSGSNVGRRQDKEFGWKLGTAVAFLTAHGIAWWRYGQGSVFHFWIPPEDLDIHHQIAFGMPVVSLVIYLVLHEADKDPEVRGLRGRALAYGAEPGDYAPASITRLSLHSALAGGAIWGILTQVKEGSIREFPIAALSLAILFGMFAALCYSQAHRWTSFVKSETLSPRINPQLRGKRDLLNKATIFDQISWYALTTGFIWTLALARPGWAIFANFLLGLLLWLYYFEFGSREDGPKMSYWLTGENIQKAVQAKKEDIANAVNTGPTRLEQWKQERKAEVAVWLDELIAKLPIR